MRYGRITRSQIVAALLLPIIAALLGLLYIIVVCAQGRPFFFVSQRMRDADTSFGLYKIRTMHPADDTREMVLAGKQRDRVTAIGRFLRRTRLDELPQIINVLRGDINFIGPRPPLRTHVEACPKHYRHVLALMRPGITGLSTVMVHRREERLLANCKTVTEAEETYLQHCLPIKLRLDLIYAERRSLALDALILWRTVARLLPAASTRVPNHNQIGAGNVTPRIPSAGQRKLPLAA